MLIDNHLRSLETVTSTRWLVGYCQKLFAASRLQTIENVEMSDFTESGREKADIATPS